MEGFVLFALFWLVFEIGVVMCGEVVTSKSLDEPDDFFSIDVADAEEAVVGGLTGAEGLAVLAVSLGGVLALMVLLGVEVPLALLLPALLLLLAALMSIARELKNQSTSVLLTPSSHSSRFRKFLISPRSSVGSRTMSLFDTSVAAVSVSPAEGADGAVFDARDDASDDVIS